MEHERKKIGLQRFHGCGASARELWQAPLPLRFYNGMQKEIIGKITCARN